MMISRIMDPLFRASGTATRWDAMKSGESYRRLTYGIRHQWDSGFSNHGILQDSPARLCCGARWAEMPGELTGRIGCYGDERDVYGSSRRVKMFVTRLWRTSTWTFHRGNGMSFIHRWPDRERRLTQHSSLHQLRQKVVHLQPPSLMRSSIRCDGDWNHSESPSRLIRKLVVCFEWLSHLWLIECIHHSPLNIEW